jgi:putative peptidoglycan lipid II flippase
VNRQAIARAAVVVAALGVLSRILGFVREAVLARTFGTEGETAGQADAFTNALFIVNTVAAVLLYLLVTLVIPQFEQERQERGEESAWRLIWVIAAYVVIAVTAVALLAAIWPQAPAALFGLDDRREAILTDLVRIMSVGLALQGLSGLLTAVLQSQRRFVGPAAVGVAFNLGIILGLAIGGGTVRAAAWGVVAGACAQVLFQLPQLVAVLRRAPGRPALRHPRLALVSAAAVPVLAASLLQQINGFTDKLFAGTLEEGRVAALNFANAAGAAPRSVLLVPLLTPFFPVISRMAAERRGVDTARAFERAAAVLAAVSVPLTVYLMLFPEEVARLLFGGNRCGADCVETIAGPLRFSAMAVWAAFIGYLLNRTLSALNRARDVMVATVITVVLTIVLDLILLGPMGISGLALATAVGIIVNTVVTALMLRRSLDELRLRHVFAGQVRVALAGCVAGAAAFAATAMLRADAPTLGDATAILAVGAAVGAGTFAVAARLLAPEAVAETARSLRAIVRRRSSS